VITGAVEEKAAATGEEGMVEGHTRRILQKPGWVFGDLALLFNSSRTASVVAKTNITVWALDKKNFLKFVMKHAQVRGCVGIGSQLQEVCGTTGAGVSGAQGSPQTAMPGTSSEYPCIGGTTDGCGTLAVIVLK
jgi:hypothetical protein